MASLLTSGMRLVCPSWPDTPACINHRTVHIASDAAWDIEEIAARMFPGHDGSDGAMAARSLELESRNLADTCQAVASCIKFGAQYTLLAGVNAWITAAEYGALQVGKDLWSFLNAPFISTSLGVGIGGQIGGLGSGTECSTSSEAADVLGAVLNSQLANAPGTGNLSVQLTGPSGTWTITLMAGQPDVNFAPTC